MITFVVPVEIVAPFALARTAFCQETRLDDTDTTLLNRFRDPPLPGLELLLQFFEAPPDTQAQE